MPLSSPDNSTTPSIAAPPPATQNPALAQGLNLNFGDVVRQIVPYVSGGAPVEAYEQYAKAQGDALKQAQKQKIAETEATQKAAAEYGGSADQALKQYETSMAEHPLPAFVPTKETVGDISMLGGLLAIVGFLTGKGKGMQSGLSALDSMTGMLRGWQEGRHDLYERELLNFRANFDAMRVAHEEYMQQLQNALGVAKIDLTKGLMEAQLAASKAGDPVVEAQARALNIKGVIDAMNGQSSAMDKALGIAAKLYTTESANLPLDPTTMNYWVKRIRAGDPMPALGFGAQNLRKELLQGVAHDAIKSGSSANVDQAMGQIRKANEQALARVTTTRGLIENYEQTATKSSYLVEQLAQKGVGPTGTPIFDKWLQAGRRATGDPDVTAFNNSIQTLVNEYAKVMSGGYGASATAEGAINRAQTLISEASNMRMLHSALNVMRTEMDFRRSSLVEEQQTIQTELQNPGSILSPPPAGPNYSTPEAVRDALRAGALTRSDATKILKDQFGYTD